MLNYYSFIWKFGLESMVNQKVFQLMYKEKSENISGHQGLSQKMQDGDKPLKGNWRWRWRSQWKSKWRLSDFLEATDVFCEFETYV